MSNLKNFNNIFANLAESAYSDRPLNYPPFQKDSTYNRIDYSEDTTYKNSQGEISLTLGGTHLPNNGIVYLQPDPTLHAVEEKSHNPGAGFLDKGTLYSSYQKVLLTDEKAGFNSYFVTDTPTLNADTKNTYLAIRGSTT